VTFTGGYSAQSYKGNYFNASRQGYSDTSQDQRVLNLGSSSISNGGNNYNPWGLQSAFVRANYAFQNKYLLTATFRADGSSKFAPGKRWGYFPAFSAGWRISDENFYSGGIKRVLPMLKLTGGWGQLGNQNVGDFQYLSVIQQNSGYGYNLGASNTTNYAGSVITSLANPNITWERAVTTTISLEASALENHLTGTITYFNKNTSDMLIPFQLVETFGAQRNLPDDPGNVTLPDFNIGELNNRGVEIELGYRNTVGKVSYTLGVNGSFLKNKVTKLYGTSTYLASTPYGRENTDIARTYEGQPIASFYGFKANGLYQSQDDINKYAGVANDPNKANIRPGDVRFVDINGDGKITDSDRVRLGDPNPRFVFGFNGSVSFSRFDLAFNFVGATGFQLYDADRLSGLDATQVYNWYADQKNRWHGAGTSNSIPRLSIANLNDNYRSSSMWVFSGNYLSLKSLTLGYTLQRYVINDWKIPEIRLYLSSYNVFMLTKYPGYTPELGYTNAGSGLQRGVDLAQYPAARSFTVGGTINF
jgi:TonB-linked SusC/RagA family outer membrane protein